MSAPSSNSGISWITFAENRKDVTTAIHFFPYSGSISATYPVDITLTVFGSEFETIEVTMDGARLSQPEGIMLSQVFPALLNDYQGIYGVKIKIGVTARSELDLSASKCFTEIYTPERVVRFAAKKLSYNDGQAVNSYCLAREESSASIVTLNFSEQPTIVNFPAGLTNSQASQQNDLKAFSVTEHKVSRDFCSLENQNDHSGIVHQNTAIGKVAVKNFSFYPGPNLTYFNVYRDKASQQPIAVNTL